jgi:hypothetical protein
MDIPFFKNSKARPQLFGQHDHHIGLGIKPKRQAQCHNRQQQQEGA